MKKAIYCTSFFLVLSTINISNAIIDCLQCNRNLIIPCHDCELKELKIPKAFIAVFFYKKNLDSNNIKPNTVKYSEDTTTKKEGRIIFFTKTGKPIKGKDIHTLTYKLNLSVKQLLNETDLIDCLFENNSEHLTDTEKISYKKMDIEIIYINNLGQLLSKETNTREKIKKLLLIEDKKFRGTGRFGPNDKDKLKHLGIDLELSNQESKALKEAVEYSIKKRREKQYEVDKTASTSKQEVLQDEQL